MGCAALEAERRRGRRRVLVTAVAALVSACGAGGSGGDVEVFEDGPGDEFGEIEPLAEGSRVAVLETPAPEIDEFMLRGTIPVPKGSFPRADGLMPFSITDYDGTLLETQVEPVTWFPNAALDGAEVVEVIARVHRDPAVAIGDRDRYDVFHAPHAGAPPVPPNVGALKNTPRALSGAVRNLLDNPGSIRIRAYDCFGREYKSDPLVNSPRMEFTRYGYSHTQLRVYETMTPNPPVPGPQGTLPHFLGVHSYISTYRGEDVIGLDLRFNNGHSGDDPSNSALGKIYFQRVEVVIPNGWVLLQHATDPFFGAPYGQAGMTVYPLVAPNGDGKMHVMRWQSQFHRRLALAPAASFDKARTYLNQAGLGFVVRGIDPDEGHELYSWWNRGTARWFPQSFQLPDLGHVGLSNLRAQLRDQYDFLASLVASGGSQGIYPVESGVLGWGHPYGVGYGGMTGGAEIHMTDGVKVAYTGSPKGYRNFLLTHRMHTDRQPTALYDQDGDPSSVETWLVNTGNPSNSYVPFEHFNGWVLGSSDPHGVTLAPQFQVQHVAGTGLQPSYEGAHMGFDPHDYQHYIRYTRSPKVLVWLGNDPLAKDDLRMMAENFNLSYHQYKNSQYGNIQVTGLRAARTYVDDHWMSGFRFGRGQAWGLDSALAAYACADQEWRATKYPWLEYMAQVLNDGQAACSGFVQAYIHNKFVNGLYRARQAIEQAIMENAFRGMSETVFEGADPAMTAMVRDVLEDSLWAFISPMAWFPGQQAPWTYTAVGPLDESLPVWCSAAQIPGNGYTPAYESYQNWSSFAYGYEETGSPQFLDKATVQVGGGNLLTQLENTGTGNLENMSALLALMQRLNGDI